MKANHTMQVEYIVNPMYFASLKFSGIFLKVQGDQLNMDKVTCPVYTCTVAYTEQVTFYKVPEKHGHINLVSLYNSKIF